MNLFFSSPIQGVPMSQLPADARRDASPRLESIDLLRGLAMVIMALDHVRDFFHDARFDPLDLTQTTPLLFITRWVTHHCAPAFVFLAGTGAFLSLARGKSKGELSKFLVTRGLWLVFLELTVVRFGWLFNIDYSLSIGQVIWAIGWSMVVLAFLVHLPRVAIGAIAVGMIGLHNLFDGVDPALFGSFGWLWRVLHVQSPVVYAPGRLFFVIYPLIPWIGVMAAGYVFGGVLAKSQEDRRRTLYRLGFGLIGGFLILRASNFYGDLYPWSAHETTLNTVLAFIDTHKYPPSLLYLMMTLGPAIAVLPLLERWRGRGAEVIIVFGRVPLFYYVLHIYLIHILAVAAAFLTVGDAGFLFSNELPGSWPNTYGFGLGIVYAVWIGAIALLYFPCKWFAGVKKRNRSPWLSYL
jgi:uncharacterized membrane protein